MSRRRYGRYRIVLADPPWHYRDRNKAGNRQLKYGTTVTDVLSRLDVGSICARDAALFLWVTGPQLADGLRLVAAWGFRFSTIAFAWTKTRSTAASRRRAEEVICSRFGAGEPDDRSNARAIVAALDGEGLLLPTLHVGQGQSTRANVELVLLGWRGRLERVAADVRQPLLSPLLGHSRKPDEVHHRIERLLGDRPRIELFARRRIAGWDAWGDQVPGGNDVEIPLVPDASAPATATGLVDPRQTTIFDMLEACNG